MFYASQTRPDREASINVFRKSILLTNDIIGASTSEGNVENPFTGKQNKTIAS